MVENQNISVFGIEFNQLIARTQGLLRELKLVQDEERSCRLASSLAVWLDNDAWSDAHVASLHNALLFCSGVLSRSQWLTVTALAADNETASVPYVNRLPHSCQLDSFSVMLPCASPLNYLSAVVAASSMQRQLELLSAASTECGRQLLVAQLMKALSRQLDVAPSSASTDQEVASATRRRQLAWQCVPVLHCLSRQLPRDATRLLRHVVVDGHACDTVSARGTEVLALVTVVSHVARQLSGRHDEWMFVFVEPRPCDDDEDEQWSSGIELAAARAVTIFRDVTVDVWLAWAEEEPLIACHVSPLPEECTVQAAIAHHATLLCDAIELSSSCDSRTEQRRRTGVLSAPVSQLAAMLSQLVAHDTGEQLSLAQLSERASILDSPRRLFWLHRLVRRWQHELTGDWAAAHQNARCPAASVDTLVSQSQWLQPADLQCVGEVVAMLPHSATRDSLIEMVCSEIWRRCSDDRHQMHTAVTWLARTDARRADWSACLSRSLARLTVATAADTSAANLVFGECCRLMLQCVSAWLQYCVHYSTQSDGAAQLICTLLPAVHSVCDLRVTFADQAPALDTTLLEQLRLCGDRDLKRWTRVSQLLLHCMHCDAVCIDYITSALLRIDCHSSLILTLLQMLADAECVWCEASWLAVGEFVVMQLDRTLNLDRGGATVASVFITRQKALCCLRSVCRRAGDDSELWSLVAHCHPLTKLHCCFIMPVLSSQAASVVHSCSEQLATPLRCLVSTDEWSGAWNCADHALVTATLVAYMPFMCDDEWRTVHRRLLRDGVPNDRASVDVEQVSQPLVAAVWYYGDLIAAWLGSRVVADDDSTTGGGGAGVEMCDDALTHCVGRICQLITDSLAQTASRRPSRAGVRNDYEAGGPGTAADEPIGCKRQEPKRADVGDCADSRAQLLSQLLLPLAYMLKLLQAGGNGGKYGALIQAPLERLAMFVCTVFLQQMNDKAYSAQATHGEWSQEGPHAADTYSHALSQFIVGFLNIPARCELKKQVLQRISDSVLSFMLSAQCIV